MPRGDRRGPEGAGSMTGRGLGFCAGNDQPGYGRGRGRGMGYGRSAVGRSRGAYYEPTAENDTADLNSPESRNREITRLENLSNTLSNELEIVKSKIDELKNN
jgi:hypothetical protein